MLLLVGGVGCARHGGPRDEAPHVAVLAVSVAESPQELLERVLAVDLDAPAGVFVVCTSPDEPEEQLLVESPEAALHHELAVRGLLADVAYTCQVRPLGGGDAVEVGFTASGPDVPAFEVEDPEGAAGGWTLFNTQAGASNDEGSWLLVVDADGRVRWSYFVVGPLVGDIDVELIDGATAVHVGGGWAWFLEDQPNRGVFRDLDLSGDTLLERALPDFGLGFNHHSEKLADGSYLSNVGSVNHSATDEWNGVGIERWDPERGLVWTWDSQSLVDAGELAPPADPTDDTPWHANALAWVEDPGGEAVWVSLFVAQELWRLDPATGARTHTFGPHGDFVLQDRDGDALPVDQWSYVQHGPEFTADGRVLMLDNGRDRPVDVPYSRIVEYQLDLEAGVATLLWDWTEPGWYDPVQGDADWLPNGDVLVTRSFSQARTPDSPDVSQVLELRPPADGDPGEVVWRMRWTDPGWQVFRAERYDACALFPNGRYCPAVAARIAALVPE